MDEDVLKTIEDSGKLKYPPEKICNILGLTGKAREQFLHEFGNMESEIRICYEKGLSIGDFNIDIKLQEQSENGLTESIAELGKRQYYNKLSKLKQDLFGV
jgi:hypothetical protein